MGTDIQETRHGIFELAKETVPFYIFELRTPTCLMTLRAGDTEQHARAPSAAQRSKRPGWNEAPAGSLPLAFQGSHWSTFLPLFSYSYLYWKSLIGRILTTAKDSLSLYWLLSFRIGGGNSDRPGGWKRGVRRRVVGDAGRVFLLGNGLLSPRPLGAGGVCPVNCRSGGGSCAGRHAGAFQGETEVSGS